MCFRQHELARQVAEGAVQAPGFLGVVYGAPMDADWTDEAVWRMANPSLGETASIDSTVSSAAGRRRCRPSRTASGRYCSSVGWAGGAVHRHAAWDGCSAAPTKRGMAFGGLDLSATTDLTAFVVLVEGTDVYCRAFLPADGIVDRERRDRVPYRLWAEQGSLILTPGPRSITAPSKRRCSRRRRCASLRASRLTRGTALSW